MNKDYQPIYQNIDTLHVSFQCAVPQNILAKLEEAKTLAQKEHKSQPIEINQIKMQVNQTGLKGGFSYLFNTGDTGAQVAVKKDTNAQNWNLYVYVGSLPFVIRGYEGVKNHLKEIFDALKIWGCPS